MLKDWYNVPVYITIAVPSDVSVHVERVFLLTCNCYPTFRDRVMISPSRGKCPLLPFTIRLSSRRGTPDARQPVMQLHTSNLGLQLHCCERISTCISMDFAVETGEWKKGETTYYLHQVNNCKGGVRMLFSIFCIRQLALPDGKTKLRQQKVGWRERLNETVWRIELYFFWMKDVKYFVIETIYETSVLISKRNMNHWRLINRWTCRRYGRIL